ncbi:MAG: cobalamin biosynthesis protein, partial [Alphaproteobacteria bacterium]
MTKEGAETARRAAAVVPGDILMRSGLGEPGPTFDRLAEAVKFAFTAGQPVVGFCAAGILVRSVSAILTDKSDDPPVLAVSEDGASVVPLIGGHHGGNRLATAIAAALGGHAAITTAGDLRFGVALDDPPSGWVLANPADAKPVMAALLGGEQARLVGKAPWLSKSSVPFATDGTVRLSATVNSIDGGPDHLVYHPGALALGVGCERGTDPAEVADLAFETLADAGLARQAVACVVSLDVKADEAAVIDLAERLDVPARFFTPEILEVQTPRLANSSDMVFAEVGCHGVCEAAALAAAGPTGRLVVEKRKSARATCAVAQATGIIEPEFIGRARGKLSIVGLGPGQMSWRTPEAGKLILESNIVV